MGVTPLTLTSWVLPASQATKRSSVSHRPGSRRVPWGQSAAGGTGVEEEAVFMVPCLGPGPGPCSPPGRRDRAPGPGPQGARVLLGRPVCTHGTTRQQFKADRPLSNTAEV